MSVCMDIADSMFTWLVPSRYIPSLSLVSTDTSTHIARQHNCKCRFEVHQVSKGRTHSSISLQKNGMTFTNNKNI